jgi:signal transduction histidine kinase
MGFEMNRRCFFGRAALVVGAALAASMAGRARAEQRGTPEDAKAMVAKAIELYKAKGAASFDIMNKGESMGFRHGDIYIFVFRAGAQPRVVAQAADSTRVGLDVTTLTDSAGKAFGKEMLARASAEGAWVDYVRNNPVTNKEEPKSSWVRLYDGYVFGCGIYKAP